MATTDDPAEQARVEFLFRMYDQIFHDIDRHILVIWQSVSVVVGGFAVFALVEKQILPIDLASAMVVLLTAWAVAHVYDASHWYNRSIAIITNIERQFLTERDLREIHFYFESHRQHPPMLMHLQIQHTFAVFIAAIVVFYHFATRVAPGLSSPIASFEWTRATPYVVLIVSAILLSKLRRKRLMDYQEFLKRSPGIALLQRPRAGTPRSNSVEGPSSQFE